jgi:adenylylsulfate kinase-like enzyme
LPEEPIPVLWVCGPPGVGKTSVGWEIYRELARGEIEVGYVDIDQLGICSPEPPSDPGRYEMKARNLNVVVRNFGAAGARCAVVSGVVDPEHGVDRDELRDAAVTVCRLRADGAILRQRFLARGSPREAIRAVWRDAELLDARDAADACVDTTGLSVAEAARRVRESTGWPPSPSSTARLRAPTTSIASKGASGPILWLHGVTGVGKSTVGFEIFQILRRSGLAAGYVDVDQVGFCHGHATDHHLRASNLAELWQTYRGVGAQALVVVGPLESQAAADIYAEALPAATFTWCRLRAGRDQLSSRIAQRGQGGSWAQPGDPLRDQSPDDLLRVAERAVRESRALDQVMLGMRIDTDASSAAQTAQRVLDESNWPPTAAAVWHPA